METKKEPTLLGIVTLLMGLGIGAALGAWFVKSSQASDLPPVRQTLPSLVRQEPVSSDKKNDTSDPIRQMERMQEEIDRAIRNVIEQFELSPGTTLVRANGGYSSSFDLRDRKDHYELRAYLPDVNAPDVNVQVDNDRTLRVSVTQRKQERKNTTGGSESFTELGKYEQIITLPESVKSSDMRIDRRGHEVVITIPKSKPPKANTI